LLSVGGVGFEGDAARVALKDADEGALDDFDDGPGELGEEDVPELAALGFGGFAGGEDVAPEGVDGVFGEGLGEALGAGVGGAAAEDLTEEFREAAGEAVEAELFDVVFGEIGAALVDHEGEVAEEFDFLLDDEDEEFFAGALGDGAAEDAGDDLDEHGGHVGFEDAAEFADDAGFGEGGAGGAATGAEDDETDAVGGLAEGVHAGEGGDEGEDLEGGAFGGFQAFGDGFGGVDGAVAEEVDGFIEAAGVFADEG